MILYLITNLEALLNKVSSLEHSSFRISLLLPNNTNTGYIIETCNLKELYLSSCHYKI